MYILKTKKGELNLCIHKEERNIFIQLKEQMNLFKEVIVVLKLALMLNSNASFGYLIMMKYKIITMIKQVSKRKDRASYDRVKQRIYIQTDY